MKGNGVLIFRSECDALSCVCGGGLAAAAGHGGNAPLGYYFIHLPNDLSSCG